MAGDAIFDPPPIPLARKPVPVFVYRYLGPGSRELLPNIRCVRIKHGVGTKPGSAEFRYVFDRGGVFDSSSEWPIQPEQCLGNTKTEPSRYVVEQDERIQVYGFTAKGKPKVMFDGIVQLPSLSLTVQQQAVSFQALAIPVREWDTPLRKARYRNVTDEASDAPDAHILVGLPIRFNPERQGNRTEGGIDFDVHGDASLKYPVFLDAAWQRATGRDFRWTVSQAAKYILGEGMSDVWVEMPDFDTIDEILDSRVGKDGPYYDSADSTSYDSSPIEIRDLDVTGLPWPEALEKLLTPHGFLFYFDLDQDSDAEPIWKLKIVRLDDNALHTLKAVRLQRYGEATDPRKTNVGKMALTRDATEIANEIVIETRPRRAEMTFVLAPLFLPDTADVATPAAMAPFLRGSGSAPQNEDDIPKYRDYGAAEDGTPFYSFALSAMDSSSDPISLKETKAFGAESVVRRRPPRRSLFTRDTAGAPRNAVLEISWDYAGTAPAIFKAGMGGTWYPVPNGWSLLKDRIGITIDINNPDAWITGNKSIAFGVVAKSAGGIVRGISAQAKAGETRFYLRLTCVIEGDFGINAIAKKKGSSPTSFTIQRVIDARERYAYDVIEPGSLFNSGEEVTVDRDDTERAQAEADARQAAHESPPLAGPILIPRLDNSYFLGDRITKIEGRELSLQTNTGNEDEQSPRYPMIVGIEYILDGGQQTVLYCSDARGEGRF